MNRQPALERLAHRIAAGGSFLTAALVALVLMLPLIIPPAVAVVLLIWLL